MARRSTIVSGIGGSPGIAIGRVFLLDRRQTRVPKYHVESDQCEYECKRLRDAIDLSVEQMEAIRGRFHGRGVDHVAILEAHEMMLRDQALFDEAVGLIREQERNAEWAVNKVIKRIRSIFDSVSDPYFRERRTDIDFVGDRILRNLSGQSVDIAELGDIGAGNVVVARDLSPADTALLARQRTTAFVTEVGGKTSHTSIVARSLEVPAVVGAHGMFDAAGDGDIVIVDGSAGLVTLRPTRAQLEQARERSARYDRVRLDLLEARELPARSLDGVELDVGGNIELPHEVATVLARGGSSIGLYRTEFIFVGRREPPGEEDHYRTYCQIFDEVGDRPVTIRTLDLGGDKIFAPNEFDAEPNPVLGLRAIRYCLQHRALFEAQIAGLLRAAPRGDLRIMIPMISSIHELREARAIIEEVRVRLVREGKEHKAEVPVGIMIEVPSAVVTADVLAKEADFFSIGTNDLIQYLFAIDRTNDRVAYLYRPLHPAMLRTLRTAIEHAKHAGIPLSVCGEMAGEPEHAAILMGFGVDQLSMNAGSIPQIKRLVREISQQDSRVLLAEALECTTSDEVEALVQEFLESKAPNFTDIWQRESL